MKYILSYIRPFVGKMMIGFSIKFVGTIMDLFLPMLLSIILDDIVPTGDKRAIFLCGGLMVICSIIAILGNIGANRMAARVAETPRKRSETTSSAGSPTSPQNSSTSSPFPPLRAA